MTAQNLTIRFPAPFPSTVAGDGGIAVSKENGVWIIEPDFSALGAILPAALADPTAKQIWVFDPVTEIYNVLTLGGLGEALYKATSTTSLAIGAGSKTFVTQSGKDFSVGSYVLATSDANPANYMLGQVTAYGGTSLTISVAATSIGGSGTYADWTLRASSPAGPQGVAGAGYTASSTTSLTVGTGSKAFTTQAGLAYTVGARVRASSAANGANYMEGLVTGYSGTTLTVNVTRTGGSGTLADWNVNLAGDPGTGDVLASNNLSDVASPKTAFDNISVRGADIASASTINLDGATGNLVDVTGTTTVTAITLADGRERTVRFTGALTLTNGASLMLPGGQNIVTAAGDYAVFRGDVAGVVRCVSYQRVVNAPGVFGTAALKNIGTSGNNVPLLDGTNNWLSPQFISGTTLGFNGLNINTTHAANVGAALVIEHASPSPAFGDFASSIYFYGRDSAGNSEQYAQMSAVILDPTSGSEDVEVPFYTIRAGAYAQRFSIGDGAYLGSPTGGDKGLGTLNATAVYDDNVLLTCMPMAQEFFATGTVDLEKWDALVPDQVVPALTQRVPVMQEVTKEIVVTKLAADSAGYIAKRESKTFKEHLRLWTPIYDEVGNGVDAVYEPQYNIIEHPERIVTRRHEVAHEFAAMLADGFDPRNPHAYLEKMHAYLEKMKADEALPGMPNKENWRHNALSLGQMATRKWLAMELLAHCVNGLTAEHEALRARVAELESRANQFPI